MEKRVALFEGCSTIEAGVGSCKELESALDEMSRVLADQSGAPVYCMTGRKQPQSGSRAAPTGFEAAAPAGFEWGETF
eukprot:CAMPEP_0119096868 /NCGR_PEP_ID=MMETSP1178-20130426/174243_1 /TAXON_ID=33656 /ORGANISM="unid sp, Strain CCMP2000" /LENGTH=77 /DNA_ID=CAMNT_0007080779 /DNA_START=1 /DNA_END=234 /DNA_ORIENTATION=+